MTSVELAERALALLRIPSVIGQERELADAVEGWALQRYSRAHVRRVSHSLVVGNTADPRPMVLLVGHLDTVPAHPDGHVPRIEGDRLFGLGASDMKGAVAVMQALVETLPLAELPVNVVVVLYEREEGPYLESGLGPVFDAVPELKRAAFSIAMEPTDGAVQVGCVGSLQALVRFRGQAAHSARPWQGRNAIHAAGELLQRLHARERVEVSVAGYSYFEVLSATLAKGGRARNVVPDEFELNLNYRFAPGKSVAQAEADVRAVVGDVAEVSITDAAPSGRVCADNAFFTSLVHATGRPAEAKQAWTDVARLSAWGLDAVNFGPGETAQAHQRTESCSVAALGHSYDVLARVLTRR